MKTKQAYVRAPEIKLREASMIALGTTESAGSVIVEVEAEEGLAGYGEGGSGIFIISETLTSMLETIELFSQAIIGLNPFNIEKIYKVMDKIPAFVPVAEAAIGIACYDLMGQEAQLSLYQLLGGYDGQIVTGITLGIDGPNVMAQKVVKKVELGLDTLKIKIGTGIETDTAGVKTIHETVGFGIKLHLDMNQAWAPENAVEAIQTLAGHRIELVGQPVRRRDLEGLKYVTSQVNTTVMVDGSYFNVQNALGLVKKDTVNVINIKLVKCGGIHGALRTNQIYGAASIECVIGCMAEETTTDVTATAYLAAAQKNIARADLNVTFGLGTTPIARGIFLEAKPLLELREAAGLDISHQGRSKVDEV